MCLEGVSPDIGIRNGGLSKSEFSSNAGVITQRPVGLYRVER